MKLQEKLSAFKSSCKGHDVEITAKVGDKDDAFRKT